ncbi:hypothetical protein JB92DRAFT_2855426 [Gautieria morchelliformis]|nr:hypothetical protein JB92DRAFT_2855426 [Gautieria morchelliformis]
MHTYAYSCVYCKRTLMGFPPCVQCAGFMPAHGGPVAPCGSYRVFALRLRRSSLSP